MTFFDTSEQQCKDAFIKAGFWPNEVMWSAWEKAWKLGADAKSEELRKQEPFGWWHQGDTEDESDFHLAESGAGMDCKNCIALFAHAAPIPPITPSQQEALSEAMRILYKAYRGEAWSMDYQKLLTTQRG